MKIGIDARCLEWHRGGPARYLINMLKLWPQISRKHSFILFFQNYIPDDDFLKNELFTCVLIKGPKFLKTRRILGEQLLLPFAIKKSKIDLFFTPWYSAPLVPFCPKVVIACWDISFTTHPHHFNILERISFGFFSPASCRKAAGIITCSQFDARQMNKYLGIPMDRICVVRFAADEKFKPAETAQQLEDFRTKYNFPKRYILSMGIIIKRRNVDVVIDAFKDISSEFPDLGLVVVGRNATVPFVDIEEKMKPLIKEGRGFYFQRAPEEDIVNFYRGAWYYVCTSTVDGESLMLKEAIKSGTPVATSPLLKETVEGNAVIIDDPTDRKKAVEVFRRILQDQELRGRLAEKGLRWIHSLSWERVAGESLQFIESR